jgi:hypothetical protein
MNIQIPQHLVKRSDDYVSYTSTDIEGNSLTRNKICYADHMSKLTSHSFDLVPYCDHKNWKDYAIDGESYLRFVELFKENSLIHPSVVAEIDADGVQKMHIPIGLSRHRVYSAMCVYRWAESMSPFVFLMMKLTDERKDLSFWQILHYVMSTQVTSVGHNWCNIGVTSYQSGYVYSNNGMAYNLGLSLSFPFLWYKTEEQMLKLGGTTCTQVDSICAKIAPCKAKNNEKYGMTIPTLLVCGSNTEKPMANDVLNPIWTPLYQYASSMATCDYKEETVKEELLNIYTEITKDYEPIATLRIKLENKKN